MALPPGRRPVIVGVGFCQEKLEDPLASREALALMQSALDAALADAGAPGLAARLGSIAVLQGTWQYRNPAHALARAAGCPGARTVLADLGVLQLAPLLDLCREIAAGEREAGAVVGGEARYRALRAQIGGVAVHDTVQGPEVPPPDVHHPTPDPFATPAEARAGIQLPAELFAVIESALRAREGLGVEGHGVKPPPLRRSARARGSASRSTATASPRSTRASARSPRTIPAPGAASASRPGRYARAPGATRWSRSPTPSATAASGT